MPQRRALIRAAVLCSFAAYAGIAVGTIHTAILKSKPVQEFGPYQTSDSYLEVFGAPKPSLLVQNALRRYAPNTNLLVVTPVTDPLRGQIYCMIAYLAYPRPVGLVYCGAKSGASPMMDGIDRVSRSAPIGGLVFFHADPGPNAAGGTQVAPGLYMSPYHGTAPWESFCH
jgi:hypothetical protein